MDDSIIEPIQIQRLKKRIPYNKDIHKTRENYQQIIEDLIEDSENIGLSLKYPFHDYSQKELPTRYYNWQIRCCLELYKLAGNSNIKSYSENKLNWTFFKNGLSEDLINEIIPNVRTFEKDEDDV